MRTSERDSIATARSLTHGMKSRYWPLASVTTVPPWSSARDGEGRTGRTEPGREHLPRAFRALKQRVTLRGAEPRALRRRGVGHVPGVLDERELHRAHQHHQERRQHERQLERALPRLAFVHASSP